MEVSRRLDVNSLVHLNNFIFLVFAYCTEQVYLSGEQCKDSSGAREFLLFILYGNLIVYGVIFTIQFLHTLNLLEVCTRKFGAVCITINTFVFFGAVVIFDFISMIYGIKQHFLTISSKCKELELFTMCCAYIFTVWVIMMCISLLHSIFIYLRPQRINEPSRQYGML